jgi:outer membrane protein
MKRWTIGVGIAALIMGAWLGVAWPASPATSPGKIGFIDMQRFAETSERGKEYREKIFQLRNEKEKLLSGKQEELNRLRQDFQQKSVTLSDRARLDKEQEIRQKELEFQNLAETARQEVLMEGQKLQTIMYRELSDVVRQIGQQEGYTMIVQKDAAIYVSDSLDITDKVIQQFNTQSRKGGR